MNNKKDIIKALRCMASREPVSDTCYVDGNMSWMAEAADAVKTLEETKDYIDKRMMDGGIPDIAFAVYNDVRSFIWGSERAKEVSRDKSTD